MASRASVDSSNTVTFLLNDAPLDTSADFIHHVSARTSERLIDDDDFYYARPRRRRTWTSTLKSIIFWLRQRRRLSDGGFDGFCAQCDRRTQNLFKKRRGLRKVVYIGIAVLVLLGIIQCLTIVGGILAAIFPDDIQRVLRDWEQTGKTGEGLKHWPTDFTRDIVPVPCHSHNDYWRNVPLYSGISAGCISTEADVWLFERELFVGHSTSSLTHNRTLDSLYIRPLLQILAKQNPTTDFHPNSNTSMNGIFDTDPEQTFTLLIEFKTSGPETWPFVSAALEPLRSRGYLSFWDGEHIVNRPITVVGTGNAPFSHVDSDVHNPHHDIFFDAPLDRMYEEPVNPVPAASRSQSFGRLITSFFGTSHHTTLATEHRKAHSLPPPSIYKAANSAYASASFGESIGRMWGYELTARQLKLLRGQIKGAHSRGLKARYWGLPNWPIGLRNRVWEVLVREGVDVLDVDDLEAATRRDWRRRKSDLLG